MTMLGVLFTLLLVTCGELYAADPGASGPAASSPASIADGRAARGKPVFLDDSDAYGRKLAEKAGDTEGVYKFRPRSRLKSTLDGVATPASPAEFRQAWSNAPVEQQLTGNCWAYASTSFLESEVHRLHGREIKLSELHTVYWEYVEKARGFVEKRGECEFPRGSQPNATLRIWKKYGVVPADAYTGLINGREVHADRKMYAEMKAYLASVAKRSEWNEAKVVAGIRGILHKYIGKPPERVQVDGTAMTPREYLERLVKLSPDDYVSIMSFMQQPWYQWCEYQVPDNWWHSREYYNVPLADFTRIARETALKGQTLCLGIDFNEPGYLTAESVAFIPSFDLPGEAIDDAARQLRFSNESTTDDHIVHLMGVREPAGAAAGPADYWYLIKDSDTWPRNGPHGGYMLYHEDYIRLKTLCFMMHREAAERVLGRSLR